MTVSTLPGEQVPAVPGSGEIRAEFEALISGCGVFKLTDRAKISLTGSDRVRWLNGMVTNNVRDLAPGRGVYAFVLNPQGHILGDLYAYNRGESLLVDTAAPQLPKMLELFDRYIIMDDVEVANFSDKIAAIGIAGARVLEVLRNAGFAIPELQPLEFREMTWREAAVTVVRAEGDKRQAYEIWLAPEHAENLFGVLRESGATPVGAAALELYRIALGVPRYGVDIRERDLPQETEQTRALNFTKGCYVGQEIVERIRSRGSLHRKFTGFLVEGLLPAAGTKVQAESKDVGEITSVASLPLPDGERRVALGYIRREAAEKTLQAGDARVVVAETPFVGVV